MTVVNPCGGSVIETCSTSPGLIFSVWRFPRNVLASVSWGLGGPAGTPLVSRSAKLTGSSQLALQVAKPNVHSRLSMLRAAHHLVALQPSPSISGVSPGGYSWSSMNAEPASFGSLIEPRLVSLSGVQEFWG